MQNQNKPVNIIDDRPKSREEIADMIKRMFSSENDGTEEKHDVNQSASEFSQSALENKRAFA